MRKIGIFFLTAITAMAFSGCGGATGGNTANTSNTNTNTAKTAAAAPTAETLLALDKQANEAYLKGDGKFFEAFLNDKFSMIEGGKRMDKATAVKMISGVKCETKSMTLDDPKMTMIDADTYALSYKNTTDGSCTYEGKTEKIPSPLRAATVWVRNGDKWQAVFHGENMIVDPKSPPPAPAKTEGAKEEPKKDAPKADDKMASNSSSNTAPAPPAAAPSANTAALVAVEKSGWEAWMKKDAKKLEEMTAKDLAIVGPDGSWMNRADTIKFWVEMPCENVKAVDVKNGFGTTLSANAEMLIFTGWADGTCFGQKNGSQDAMSVYVKEGGAWKLAFSFTAASAM